MFYDGVKTSDLESRSNVLKYLHGRIIFQPFEEKIHEITIWRGHGILSLTKESFQISIAMGNGFMKNIS